MGAARELARELAEERGYDEEGPPQGEEDEAEELRRIRQARLDELKYGGKRGGRFGAVGSIKASEFVAQVNRAGDGVGVVVCLVKERHYASNYVGVLLEKLAAKFSDVKFLTIGAADCIPGYPDKNVPTLLFYRDDDLKGQCVGVGAFGGDSYGIDDVEWELAQAGLVQTELQSNPHATPHR